METNSQKAGWRVKKPVIHLSDWFELKGFVTEMISEELTPVRDLPKDNPVKQLCIDAARKLGRVLSKMDMIENSMR